MGIIKESSKVTLYSGVDIVEGKKEIVFGSKSEQNAYFATKVFSTAIANKNFSYIRRTGKLKIGSKISDAIKCNYMSFVNPAFENVVFYAFITDANYVNNSTTEILYTVDYFQTFMFDVEYGYSKIEREHLSYADKLKAIQNPFSTDIYELQTAEALPNARSMEKYYVGLGEDTDDVFNFPRWDESLAANEPCAVIQIANFDTSAFTQIMADFYQYFDVAIDSGGNFLVRGITDLPTKLDFPVGRGYGTYVIRLNHTKGSLGIGTDRLKKVIDWLTIQGLSNEIIGMYQSIMGIFILYMFMSVSDRTNQQLQVASFGPGTLTRADGEIVDSEKLHLSPFTYIRVYNNEGDCKEYKYEDFRNMQIDGASGTVEFVYFPLFEGTPMTSCMPINYRHSTKELYNSEERIDCHQIPQIGYNTDSYLAFLASQYNMNIASRTNTIGENVNQVIDKAYGSDNMLTKILGSIGMSARSTADSGYDKVITGVASDNYTGATGALANTQLGNVRNEVVNWRSGTNYQSQVFGPAKAAYVADEYHAGSTNGTLGYYLTRVRAAGVFTIEKVQMKPIIYQIYDDFFKAYGYTSNRLGVPRVCNYIKGKTSNSDIPYFADVEGQKITYIKTSDMKVEHAIKDVSDYIENLFNGGIQFVRGNSL